MQIEKPIFPHAWLVISRRPLATSTSPRAWSKQNLLRSGVNYNKHIRSKFTTQIQAKYSDNAALTKKGIPQWIIKHKLNWMNVNNFCAALLQSMYFSQNMTDFKGKHCCCDCNLAFQVDSSLCILILFTVLRLQTPPCFQFIDWHSKSINTNSLYHPPFS